MNGKSGPNSLTLRGRARHRVAVGVATPWYGANCKTVQGLLKEVVAAEVVNVVGPSHPELVAAESLLCMVKADLVRQLIAIDRYGDLLGDLGGQNHTTRRMLEAILAVEKQHAGELGELLEDFRSRLRNKLRSKLN